MSCQLCSIVLTRKNGRSKNGRTTINQSCLLGQHRPYYCPPLQQISKFQYFFPQQQTHSQKQTKGNGCGGMIIRELRGHFRVGILPLFQNESWYTTFRIKMSFTRMFIPCKSISFPFTVSSLKADTTVRRTPL